jgi:hypothetical protein
MIGDRNSLLDQVLNSLIIERDLPVACEMFEMGFDNRRALLHDGRHHGLFIIGRSFPFDNRNSSFRTGPDAGSEPVAEQVGDQPCFPVNNLEGPLRAVRDALAAPRAFRFVDADDLSFHPFTPLS